MTAHRVRHLLLFLPAGGKKGVRAEAQNAKVHDGKKLEEDTKGVQPRSVPTVGYSLALQFLLRKKTFFYHLRSTLRVDCCALEPTSQLQLH